MDGGEDGIRTHGTLASTTVFEFDGRCVALYRPGLIDAVLSRQSRTYVPNRPIPSHFVMTSLFANRFAKRRLGTPPRGHKGFEVPRQAL